MKKIKRVINNTWYDFRAGNNLASKALNTLDWKLQFKRHQAEVNRLQKLQEQQIDVSTEMCDLMETGYEMYFEYRVEKRGGYTW